MKHFQDKEPSIRLLRDIFGMDGPAELVYEAGTAANYLVAAALSTLTPREQMVVRLRYGFDQEPLTLRAIGQQVKAVKGPTKGSGVSTARVAAILAKCLRKLRHPQRSRALRPIWELLWPNGN